MSRVTVIHRYFWPDTPPYASMLRRIGQQWADEGHAVEVLTAQPSYTAGQATRRPRVERLGSLRVERLPVLRRASGVAQLVNLVAFPLAVAARLLTRTTPAVVMCSTAPQVTLGWVVSLVARLRGAAFVYHCMDIHPEIGRLSGEFANPLVFRVLSAMDTATMRRSERIIVLSDDMRRAVEARDPALGRKVVTINNFSLPDDGSERTSPLPGATDALRIVFTGNLGRFQGLGEVVAALGQLPPGDHVELVFMGEGKAKRELERAAAQLTAPHVEVKFLPHGSSSQAKALMASADLGLVSLVPGVAHFAYPSKTATYAVEGLPLLVVVEPGTELASTVREHGLGWSVPPGDTEALAGAIHEAVVEGREGLAARRADVRRYAETEFAEPAALAKWSSLLSELPPKRKAS